MNTSAAPRARSLSGLHRLVLMAMLIALGVVTSYMSAIPFFGAKLFPAQAMINVIAGALIGPWYGAIVALCIALVRISLGTGSLLAIPGSIFGAMLAGLLYQTFRSRLAAMLGEVIGTGVVAALVAYPIAVYIMNNKAAASASMFFFVASFGTSSLSGAILGGIILAALGPWLRGR